MDFVIVQAGPDDACEILALRKKAYQSEASLNDDWTLPPLFTGTKSIRNIRFYKNLGYRKFREDDLSPKVRLVFMEKGR